MKRIILALLASFWIVNIAAYAQESPQKPSDSAKERYGMDDEKMKELQAQREEGVKLREGLDKSKDNAPKKEDLKNAKENANSKGGIFSDDKAKNK